MIRQRLLINGIVQGVGFRPFVYRLAQTLGLSGWVRNDTEGVTLEVQGMSAAVAEFYRCLQSQIPPLARIDSISRQEVPLDPKCDGFSIVSSEAKGARQGAAIGPDATVCPACLAEMFDPLDRRYRYAFINCTDCGPRYTIARRLPYDRAQTSMAGFVQCPSCLSEYGDPASRRFHAEPNACPSCGPKLQLIDAQGQVIAADPIAETLARILCGEIIAIKGLGGFHLVCDARNAKAVKALRERKQREEKPLAVMVANAASCTDWVHVTDEECALLQSRARPIVLLRKRPEADELLAEVAPDLAWLGVLLPYTPLHTLLFHEAAGRPHGVSWLSAPHSLILVMTSANPHGEPLVTENDDAIDRLAGITDAFLLHDRDIVIRCDDSVLRHVPGAAAPQFIRRARGFTPLAIPLAQSGSQVLALGGFYKNTLCLTRDMQAFLSQHIGDLDRVANCRVLEFTIEHLQHLLQIRPQAVAHDLHPDFFSTQLALRLSERWQVPTIGVQHHHAHIGAILAEHGVDAPTLGLALDGVGYGLDGTAWGGELLLVDGARFERLGSLRPIGLPGGDRAAREPWRMGAAALALLGRGNEIGAYFTDEPDAANVAKMLAYGVPLTTSMGRWFDAAAGLLGIKLRMSFEGQAAMLLEGLAEQYGDALPDSFGFRLQRNTDQTMLDLAPLLASLTDGRGGVAGAALFHAGLINGLAEWVAEAADSCGIRRVACGGGCFLNAILARGLRQALRRRDIAMLEAQVAPPSDGGLSLGQAWVARHHGF